MNMPEAQYEYIKEHSPRWAAEVETDAIVLAKYRNAEIEADKRFKSYCEGILDGLAIAGEIFGIGACAHAFIMTAIENAIAERMKGE